MSVVVNDGDVVADFDCVSESVSLGSPEKESEPLRENDAEMVTDFDPDTSCESVTLMESDIEDDPDLDAVSVGVNVTSSDMEKDPLRLEEALSDGVPERVNDSSSEAERDGVPADFVWDASRLLVNDVDDEEENESVTSFDAVFDRVPTVREADSS